MPADASTMSSDLQKEQCVLSILTPDLALYNRPAADRSQEAIEPRSDSPEAQQFKQDALSDMALAGQGDRSFDIAAGTYPYDNFVCVDSGC